MSEPTRQLVETAAAAAPRGLTLWHFFGLLGVLTALHVGAGLARGSLVPSLNGVLLGPTLIAALVWLVLGCVQAVRAGDHLKGGVPLALLVGLVGFVASGVIGRFMIFPGDPTPLPRTGKLGADGEVVEYTTDDGVALRGLLVRAPGAGARQTLVYFHGNAESVVSNLDLAQAFAARGLDVFVAEYRGYGGCPGTPSEDGLLRDARAAVAAACARTGAAPASLVLFGRSLGTGVASAMAAEGVGRAVVLLSPYTSILDIACDLVPRPLALLALRDTFDSRARLARATQPVVVIHGTRDQVIPYAHGAALVEALGPRATLVRLDGCDHNDVFAREAPRIFDAVAAVTSGR